MFISPFLIFFLMIQRPPRSTRTGHTLSLHDALPFFREWTDGRQGARHGVLRELLAQLHPGQAPALPANQEAQRLKDQRRAPLREPRPRQAFPWRAWVIVATRRSGRLSAVPTPLPSCPATFSTSQIGRAHV